MIRPGELAGRPVPECRVVYSNLKLVQLLPLNTLPNSIITLTLSIKISEIKNGSFSGLSLPERLLWSVLWLEPTLVSRVNADVCEPSLLMSVVCVAAEGHVDVHDPSCHGNHVKVYD